MVPTVAISLNEGIKTVLLKFFQMTLGVDSGIKKLERIDDGANKNTHIVATLENGRMFGIKAAERVGGFTKREFLCPRIAQILDLSGAGMCSMTTMPDGDPHVANKEVFVYEWLEGADKIQNLPMTPARSANATARQLGSWVAFAVHLGSQIVTLETGLV